MNKKNCICVVKINHIVCGSEKITGKCNADTECIEIKLTGTIYKIDRNHLLKEISRIAKLFFCY